MQPDEHVYTFQVNDLFLRVYRPLANELALSVLKWHLTSRWDIPFNLYKGRDTLTPLPFVVTQIGGKWAFDLHKTPKSDSAFQWEIAHSLS